MTSGTKSNRFEHKHRPVIDPLPPPPPLVLAKRAAFPLCREKRSPRPRELGEHPGFPREAEAPGMGFSQAVIVCEREGGQR